MAFLVTSALAWQSPAQWTAHSTRARARSIFASLDGPLWDQKFEHQPLSLPPAAERNVVAEIMAAAEIATRRSGRGAADRPENKETARSKPVRLVSVVVSGVFQQLVADEIDQLTDGKHAGKTWLRPLAMRSCKNATAAADAFRYDPQLGWFVAEPDTGIAQGADVMSAEVHIFSPLVPAVFLPTSLVVPADPSLALTVRLLCDAHAAQVSLDVEGGGEAGFFSVPDADRQRLRPFLFAVSSQQQT